MWDERKVLKFFRRRVLNYNIESIHRDDDLMEKKIDRNVKVIGAGWGRTGTTSFKAAMEILGLKCYHMVSFESSIV